MASLGKLNAVSSRRAGNDIKKDLKSRWELARTDHLSSWCCTTEIQDGCLFRPMAREKHILLLVMWRIYVQPRLAPHTHFLLQEQNVLVFGHSLLVWWRCRSFLLVSVSEGKNRITPKWSLMPVSVRENRCESCMRSSGQSWGTGREREAPGDLGRLCP